jgi:Transglycosylase SLT domain
VLLPVAVVALAGIVVAAVGLTQVDAQRVATGLGLPVSYVQSARKWATLYRVPFEWVLATILVESGGKPNVRGDADGRSLGLMQVNVVAHAKEMAAAGVTATQMLNPDTNIQWGTKYLREFKDQVEQALGGRTVPIPESWVVRLAYKGPTTVLSALQKGQNPADISWAHDALRRWAAAMERVGALTGKGAAV